MQYTPYYSILTITSRHHCFFSI